jgi:hypothetical protein
MPALSRSGRSIRPNESLSRRRCTGTTHEHGAARRAQTQELPSIHLLLLVTESRLHSAVIAESPGRVNADVFISFLKRLMQGVRKSAFLIVDGHPTHKAVKVGRFVETGGEKLKRFFLPPYPAEWNPEEHVETI